VPCSEPAAWLRVPSEVVSSARRPACSHCRQSVVQLHHFSVWCLITHISRLHSNRPSHLDRDLSTSTSLQAGSFLVDITIPSLPPVSRAALLTISSNFPTASDQNHTIFNGHGSQLVLLCGLSEMSKAKMDTNGMIAMPPKDDINGT